MSLGLSENSLLLHRYKIQGVRLEVYDFSASKAADYVAGELNCDAYGLRKRRFKPNDCVLDIGGHIGLFSIWLALRFPTLRIYAYEPYPPNYRLFQRNLALNRVNNVELHPEAVTGDGRDLELAGSATNSGAFTACSATLKYGRMAGIPSLTLDAIFARHSIERCSVLKIDCEGSEYEALLATTAWPKIDLICGEFHINEVLEERGFSPDSLRDYCLSHSRTGEVHVTFCRSSP